MSPKLSKPLLKHTNKNLICPGTDHLDKRKALLRCHPKRGQKKRDENALVLPAVQLPLVFPKPDRMAEQRLGIADWPQVANRRAAGTEEIAQQVKMKGEQAEQQDSLSLLGIKRKQN